MKTIYLLRHAKSSWADPGLDDIDRPLGGRGKRAAEAMATYLNHARIRPGLILCSPAKRTRATLKRIQSGLGKAAPVLVEDSLYGADAGTLLALLRSLDDAIASVMLIGHNPALENLAHRLGRGDGGDGDALARMTVKFPTGALAVLETDSTSWRELEPDGTRLAAFVCPRDLA